MIKFKEFNRKWRPIVREIIETLANDGLLNIVEKDVTELHYVVVSTDKEEAVCCNAMSKDINLYEIDIINLLATKEGIRRILKERVKNILTTLTKEKNICYTDTEFNTLLELLVKTVIATIGNGKSYNLPIFRYVVPELGYVKVYPNYREIINGQNKTRKTLTIEELGKEILGEFRRRMRLRDKWFPTSYELYKEYMVEGIVKTSNLKRKLDLLVEKTPDVKRGKIKTKNFVKIFTAFSRETINEMSDVELNLIKDALLNLSTAYKFYINGGKINIDNHIPPYFEVSIKFK